MTTICVWETERKLRPFVKLGIFTFIILVGVWLASLQYGYVISIGFCSACFIIMSVWWDDRFLRTLVMLIWCIGLIFLIWYVPAGNLIFRNGTVEYADGGFYSPFENDKPTFLFTMLARALTVKNELPKGWHVSIYYEPPSKKLDSEKWQRILQLCEEGVEIPIELLDPTSESIKADIQKWFEASYPHKKVEVNYRYLKDW